MTIKGFELMDATVMEIGKFSILWNRFEHDWCSNNCNPAKIKAIANIIQLSTEAQAQLAQVINKRRHWFDQLEMDYIRDSLHPEHARGSTEDDMELMRKFLAQSGTEPCGCLLVVNRIRNNLMHGIKMIEELDGQIELFQAANAVLESI